MTADARAKARSSAAGNEWLPMSAGCMDTGTVLLPDGTAGPSCPARITKG